MALDEDLYTWAQARPWWQQLALSRLAAGYQFSPSDLEVIADKLMGEPPPIPDGGWLGPSLRPTKSAEEQVRLVAVRDVRNINALVDGQVLTFAPDGLTVVYGANGSGKSGYARLLKRSVRSRHRDEILPDIFDSGGVPSEAVIEYTIGTAEAQAALDGEDAVLAQVAFYDEQCGDCYVTVESDIRYRPAALNLLDSLISVCDGVRRAIDGRLSANAAATAALPALAKGTEPARFLASLNAETTDDAINAACAFGETASSRLETVVAEETRLRGSDPRQEAARLNDLASSLDLAAAALIAATSRHGPAAETNLRLLLSEAKERRAAAEIASSATFDSEPVSGVGTQTWRTLWGAAREFCEQTAYPDRQFPVTDADARCPLCHQGLDADAAARMHRFHAFMTDTTERDAATAERAASRALSDHRESIVLAPATAVAIANVRASSVELAVELENTLEKLDARRLALVSLAHTPDAVVPASPDVDGVVARARTTATEARGASSVVDQAAFAQLLGPLVAERAALEARRTLEEVRQTVRAERDRLRERSALEAARRETATTAITRQSTELTRAYVTANVADRFSRESDRLGVERVALTDSGGHKGQLLHRPTFLGATIRADLPKVLSEGEQTALGLAGFFTEAHFDESQSALVLDDPVTSLDHLRRDKVARRLAGLAKDRQVIVFTHDAAFVTELRIAAASEDVQLTERTVARRPADQAPGICSDGHPWAVKDTRQRLDSLRNELARIKREQGSWDADAYEAQTALFAGRLSETWERIISMDVANSLVDRGTLEVRVRMMKIVAAITPDDEKQLQESYGRISRWAARHDKDQSLGYSAPTIEELEAELALVADWCDRVRKYAR